MMSFKNTLLATLLAVTLSACVGLGGEMTRAETSSWLDAKAGAVTTNVGGTWTTSGGPGANWGEATLVQDGSRFYGTLGAYNVDGAINRDHIYLVLISDKTARYTANLRRAADGSYSGKVVENGIVDHPAYPDVNFSVMTLRKVGN